MAVDPNTGQSVINIPGFDQRYAQFVDPSQIGPLAAQQQQFGQQGQLGAALMQRGYVPNSGFGGAIAQAVQAMMGMKMLKDSREEMAGVNQKMLEAAQAAAQKAHDQQLADKKFDTDESIRKDVGIDAGKNDYKYSHASQNAAYVGAEEGAKSNADLPNELTKINAQGKNSANAAYIGATAGKQADIANMRAMGATDDQIKAHLVGTDAMMMGGPMGQAAAAGATGDDYLKQLPANQAATVKALAEGRMAFPGGAGMRSPYWQGMLQAVSAYDPNFDAVNYQARSKTRQDFTSGKEASSVNALNTAIGHAGELSDSAAKLNNFGGVFTPLNSVKNAIGNMTGDPRVTEFNVNRDALASEAERVYRGSGGSEADIKSWKDSLNGNGSPAQQQKAIAKLTELLGSKTNALQGQYAAGMGTAQNAPDFITPAAKKALSSIDARANGDAPAAAPTQTAVNPKTGQRIGLVNGQWVPI